VRPRRDSSTRRLGLANWWGEHPAVDLAAAVVLTVIGYLITRKWHAINPLATAENTQRMAVYGAGAGLMSLIAGFTGTAIALYGSSSGPVATAVRKEYGSQIRKSWSSIIATLLASSVLSIVAMMIDAKNTPRFSDFLFLGCLFAACVSFIRLVIVFKLIMVTADAGVVLKEAPLLKYQPDKT
jgi:hypothetical protein